MAPIVNSPIILDVGKAKKRDIRDVKRGRQGRILADVHDAVAEVTATAGDQIEDKQIVPVVLVYRRKGRRRRGGGGGGGRNSGAFIPNPLSVLF